MTFTLWSAVLLGCDRALVTLGTDRARRHRRVGLCLAPRQARSLATLARGEAQGLIVARGTPRGIAGVADLARPDLTIVNREPGAGSRAALDHALRTAGIDALPGYDLSRTGTVVLEESVPVATR